MSFYVRNQKRRTIALLVLLVGAVIAAISTQSEAMRPQDWQSSGCSNMGPGFPDPWVPNNQNPACYLTTNGPDCYICLYNDGPLPGLGVCSENPDGSEALCNRCDRPNRPSCPPAE